MFLTTVHPNKKTRAVEPFLRDPFGFDSWLVNDPFRDEFFSKKNSVFGNSLDLTKPFAPLLLMSELAEA